MTFIGIVKLKDEKPSVHNKLCIESPRTYYVLRGGFVSSNLLIHLQN